MSYSIVEPDDLQSWLQDGNELALLDVREHGLYGEGHLFFAVPLPYSRLEIDIARLVPRVSTRVVLCDTDEVIAIKAAHRLAALGYANLHVLRGGVEGWRDAGYTLFAGVNVPSKTFGELVEHYCDTPSVSATELSRMLAENHKLVVLDGRPYHEYRKMSIPGAVCCPNGELAYRIDALVPDDDTVVVVNCAGRTRSIIGAQTLINLGIANPVFALENGTQGWFIEGLALEHGSDRKYGPPGNLEHARARSQRLAQRLNVPYADASMVSQWLREDQRSVFLCDVRSEEEFAAGSLPGAQHTPGGQLIQATDQYVGVRGARIVVFDAEGVRASVVAGWLRQMGHDAYVLQASLQQAQAQLLEAGARFGPLLPRRGLPEPLPAMEARAVHQAMQKQACTLVDLRASSAYRAGHAAGSVWAIRPRIVEQLQELAAPFVFIADEPLIAALAGQELNAEAFILDGGWSAWEAAGLPVVRNSDTPPDSERIDYLFFVHDRHDGNREAALQYLAWEVGLLEQLEPHERAIFQPVALPTVG